MPPDEDFSIIRLDTACPAVRPLIRAPVRGVRTVNETDADVVRRVFREFPAGASVRAITGRLNGKVSRAPQASSGPIPPSGATPSGAPT